MTRTLGIIATLAIAGSTIWAAGQSSQATQTPPARSGGAVRNATPQLSTLKMPAGFAIDIYADGVRGARSMTLAPDGTLFVGTRAKSVYAVVDKDKDAKAETVLEIANGLNMPNGVAFKEDALYVGEVHRIIRYDGILDAVASGTVAGLAPKIVLGNLPTETHHGWKYLAFGPDGYLYYQIGAPCNICDRGDPYAAIWRVKPEGGTPEIVARGVRNSVGMTWHPETNALWFTENGRDMLGDEVPDDELNVAPKPGLHFGYPYCHQGDIPEPNTDKANQIDLTNRPCSAFVAPVQRLGPHVAALGLKFYGGTMFPAAYKGKLFIVNHGSWNRTAAAGPTGYRIMMATVDGNTVRDYQPFIEGFLQGRQAWGRPVDLIEMPDGSMLVSDDASGAIYRITYRK